MRNVGRPPAPRQEDSMEHAVDFSGTGVPRAFYWFNEPPQYRFDGGLELRTRGGTDFWQRTHYGFQKDDGHCLLTAVDGDFRMSCHVRFEPRTQYDQCGLMVRSDADHWIKVSTEFEDREISRLGSVVTNTGYSDWATRDVLSAACARWYRITRTDSDFLVESSEDGASWSQMRIAHLHRAPDLMEAGIYACSPKGDGFACHFDTFTLGPFTR